MNLTENLSGFIFQQKRLLITLTLILTFLGVFSLKLSPKAEDPRLPNWFAVLVVVLPGGSPSQIDEMIAQPLNEKLKELSELKKIDTSTRPELTVFQLEMKDSVTDTEEAWNKVRRILDENKNDFPSGTLEPILDTGTNDLETILLAVHGSDNILELKESARALKKELLQLSGTAKVIIHGDPKEELQIQLKDSELQKKSLVRGFIAQKIMEANSGLPAGAIEMNGRMVQLQTQSRIQDPQSLLHLALPIGSGNPIALSEVADIQWSPRKLENLTYFNLQPAIYLGVVSQHPIEIVEYGKKVRELLKKRNSDKIKVSELSFNPDRTQERLTDLGMNLAIGMLTVGLILWLWMGWRIASVVTLFLPVISLVAFQFYSMTGGVLHQISLAAFVISLGQFIDNIIVIVESMQRKIENGITRSDAAKQVIDQFKRPMLFATGTNMAAFIPMAVSQGTTAEFTKAIPAIALLTLVCAYILAIFVVPLIAEKILRPSAPRKNTKNEFILLSKWISEAPKKIIALTSIILILSSVGFVFVKQQFFPSADRNQFLVNIELQQGTSIQQTIQATQKIITFLLKQSEVESVGSFIGEAVPLFYYNIGFPETGKHMSQLIVVTKNKSMNKNLQEKIHQFSNAEVINAKVYTLNLEQGPPLQAPIEYRIFSEDPKVLSSTSEILEQKLLQHPNVAQAKSNVGEGLLTAQFIFESNLATRFGLNTQSHTLDLLSLSQGAEIGKVFKNGETLKLKLTSSQMNKDIVDLQQTYAGGSEYRDLQLKDVTLTNWNFEPTAIHRYQGQRMVRVLAWPKDGFAYNHIMQEVEKDLKLSSSVALERGGEDEGSGEANTAILTSVPLGLIVLLLCLLLEFNSLRKVSIILLSVPLVIAGVTPGLLLGNAAFGFMSLLGVLALVGIVVNNSILLIESIDENRNEGLSIKEAVEHAIKIRTRPILLTALTTIAGLLPMAFEDSTLWPPLALAMISGLIASTLLTLFFVPSLYILFFQSDKIVFNKKSLVLFLVYCLPTISLFSTNTLEAKIYTFEEALMVAKNSSAHQQTEYEIQAMDFKKQMQWRDAYLPKLGMEIESRQRGKQLTQSNFFGSFDYGKNNQTLGGLEASWTLLDLEKMHGQKNSIDFQTQAVRLNSQRQKESLEKDLAVTLIHYLELKESLRSVKILKQKLNEIYKEALRFRQSGQSGESDLLRIEMSISDQKVLEKNIENQITAIRKQIQVQVSDFTDLVDKNILENINLKTESPPQAVRNDIEALKKAITAQEYKIKATRQGYLPKLDLKSRLVYADQGLLDQKSWTEVGLVLRWNIFEGGTRQSAVASELAEKSRLQASLQTQEAMIQAEQAQAEADFLYHLESLQEAEANLVRAQKAAAEDKKNARSGKILIRDWLQSEVILEQRKLDLQLSQLRVKKFWIIWQYVLGQDFNVAN